MPKPISLRLLYVCWTFGSFKGDVAPCRTQLESHLKAMDVRGLLNHLVAYSSRALWSSDTLVVRLCPPALTSGCIVTHLYPASMPRSGQSSAPIKSRACQVLRVSTLSPSVLASHLPHGAPARQQNCATPLAAVCMC